MQGDHKKYTWLGTIMLIMLVLLLTANIWNIVFQPSVNSHQFIKYQKIQLVTQPLESPHLDHEKEGWPQAEKELGLAWRLIANSRWDHNAVRAGNPVHPLAEYRNPCWKETVSKEQFRVAYKHNGFCRNKGLTGQKKRIVDEVCYSKIRII